MEPLSYIPAYLERIYLESHPDLTEAARSLVHEDVPRNMLKYAVTPDARGLCGYVGIRERLLDELDEAEDLPDGEFEERSNLVAAHARMALENLSQEVPLPVDAQLLAILLSGSGVDGTIRNLMQLDVDVRRRLEAVLDGFDESAEHFWSERLFEHPKATAAELTRTSPDLIGWLHVTESLARFCVASARYRMAERYARTVMRAEGYQGRPEGTAFLALARLEDEEGFFSLAHDLEERSSHRGEPERAEELVDDSPWYLLGRAILFYKLGRERSARRAIRDFSLRCDGGAFFLLNPTYLAPYLPIRPAPRDSWDLSHQAVWEADGIIADTPDFVGWAEGIEDVAAASEEFARRTGF